MNNTLSVPSGWDGEPTVRMRPWHTFESSMFHRPALQPIMKSAAYYSIECHHSSFLYPSLRTWSVHL